MAMTRPQDLTFSDIERLMSEDAGDRLDREAHGFTYEDDYTDPTVTCRNGCGLTYFDVVSGKIRKCQGGAIAER
jgi:hypothetical protein